MKRFKRTWGAILLASSVAAVAQQQQTPAGSPARSLPADSSTPQTSTQNPPAAVPQTPGAETTAPERGVRTATPDAQTSAPPSGGKTSAAGMVDANHYIIGAEDILQVTVWKEPTLSGSVPVRPDGMISLVLLGDLPAAGTTPMQLSTDITQRLKKYIQDPNVSVLVTGVNSQRIFLVGEVGRVGPLNLSPGMSPLQAIAAAGGPSPYANTKHIYILRGTGASQKKIPFNYKQALKGDTRQTLSLEPGDTIVVP